MKKLLLSITLLISFPSLASLVAAFEGDAMNPFEAATDCKEYLIDSIPLCFLTTTVSLPTILVSDFNDANIDDVMVQLAEELNGEVESTKMIDKLAIHFEISSDELVSIAIELLNSKEGLNFEGLKEKIIK